jgi:RNA polymerase sigma factor (sigma-70 family)
MLLLVPGGGPAARNHRKGRTMSTSAQMVRSTRSGTTGGTATPGELVAAAARSEAGAWEALVARFGGLVNAKARGYRLSDAEVADVSQTVWLRLIEHIDRLRDPEQVASWLATTAGNEALRVVRQRQRWTPVEDVDALGVHDTAETAPPVEVEERNVQLRALVATLPTRQRALMELLMADRRPNYVEVSANLGMPVGSVGPTRQRCLRTLRVKCIAAHI